MIEFFRGLLLMIALGASYLFVLVILAFACTGWRLS